MTEQPLNSVLYKHFCNYQEEPTGLARSDFENEIYELYCYNHLLKHTKDIGIIKASVIQNMKLNNFYYSSAGKIYYQSQGISLAEFDILGVTDKTIYLWEVTRAKTNQSQIKKRINRKIALLNILFKGYNIVFKLIVPENTNAFEKHEKEIIKEPFYNELAEKPYFIFDDRISECSDINSLENISEDYNYLDEIINYSQLFFNNKCIDFDYLKAKRIIEYLYDIKYIFNKEFQYYDVQKNKIGIVKYIDNEYFRDEKRTRGIKIRAVKKELIRRRRHSVR
jgi:hypothetical protein